MELNENQLSSYFHHQNPTNNLAAAATTTVTTTTSPTNGIFPNTHHVSPNTTSEGGSGPQMVYPHSVPSSAAAVSSSPLEPARRKRGRPRKYGTPEQALAAKKASTANSNSSSRDNKKDGDSSSFGAVSGSHSLSGPSKKSQLGSLANAGQSFTPHVIDVAAGEDVGQKIMLFMQQSKREICILTALGSISNASLRQPATSGGSITYEVPLFYKSLHPSNGCRDCLKGRFEIISLCGSYIRTEIGGRTGGLSVCLSSSDGGIIGGGVGGPLKAAGPVQVIIGTFLIDTKKDVSGGVKGDASAGQLPPCPIGGSSMSNIGYRPTMDPSLRNPDGLQALGGSPFMYQPHGMHLTRPTEWRSGLDARGAPGYDFTAAKTGHVSRQSPENGDYEQMQN